MQPIVPTRVGVNLIRLADEFDMRQLVDRAIKSEGRHQGEQDTIVGLDLSNHCAIPEVVSDFKKFGILVTEE